MHKNLKKMNSNAFQVRRGHHEEFFTEHEPLNGSMPINNKKPTSFLMEPYFFAVLHLLHFNCLKSKRSSTVHLFYESAFYVTKEPVNSLTW